MCMRKDFLTLKISKQTQLFQTNTNASLENLEIQIRQLAQAVQKETKDSFPRDTR